MEERFIYTISDSEWVSPLMIVPKKNGKWRVCVDYRELNKETYKDHFPLIGIFSELVNDNMEIFMDDFTPYGKDFEEALKNLEKVLTRCE